MSDTERELALLRELEQLRRVRRNWKGSGEAWPLPEMRFEDQIFVDLDALREKKS